MMTFCDCKLSQKTTLSLIEHQNFSGSYIKSVEYWMNWKMQRISKGREVNKLWQKLLYQH